MWTFTAKKSPFFLVESMVGAANGNLDVSSTSLQHFFTARDHKLCREVCVENTPLREIQLGRYAEILEAEILTVHVWRKEFFF